jgi:hypothetical protein
MPGIDMNKRVAHFQQKKSRHNISILSPMRQESSWSDSSYTTPVGLANGTHTHEVQTLLEQESRCDWERGL